MARLRTEKTYDDHGRAATERPTSARSSRPMATVTDDYSAAQTTTYSYDQLGELGSDDLSRIPTAAAR